jgi:broad specificity phosphatase PhoE
MPAMAGPNSSTTLYLLRHPEPADDFRNVFYGQLDVPLSERGLLQARAIADRLADIPFAAVYSSDLQRAGVLADAIADPRDLPVRRLEVFRERSLGPLQGLTIEQMKERHREEFENWFADRAFYRVPGGENFEDLRDRVVPAARTLVESFPGRRIALACHAGPIRVLLADLLGMPLDRSLNLSLNYGSINVVEFPATGAPLVKLVNG